MSKLMMVNVPWGLACRRRFEKGNVEYNGAWRSMSRLSLYDYLLEELPDASNYADMLLEHGGFELTFGERWRLWLAKWLSHACYGLVQQAAAQKMELE